MITQDDVIYFIVTDRFFGQQQTDTGEKNVHGGTLDGILQKIDYLVNLGITAVWITPVYKNIKATDSGDESYHYYWPEDFELIDGRLIDGTVIPKSRFRHSSDGYNKEALKLFNDECSKHGIKVILDMVVNHAGYGCEGNFPPDWFQKGTGEEDEPLSGLPDFDHDNPEVVDFFINNISEWIEKGGIQAIRMDTVKHVEKRFWYYLKTQIKGRYPRLFLLGEVLMEGKNDIHALQRYQNYHDFDSIFDFPFARALRETLVFDQSLKCWLARPRLHPHEEKGVLDLDNPSTGGYRNPGKLVTLLDNHDLQRRIMSHARCKHPGDHNKALAHKIVKLCLASLFAARGIPQIYYGTEVGLEGWKEGGYNKIDHIILSNHSHLSS